MTLKGSEGLKAVDEDVEAVRRFITTSFLNHLGIDCIQCCLASLHRCIQLVTTAIGHGRRSDGARLESA